MKKEIQIWRRITCHIHCIIFGIKRRRRVFFFLTVHERKEYIPLFFAEINKFLLQRANKINTRTPLMLYILRVRMSCSLTTRLRGRIVPFGNIPPPRSGQRSGQRSVVDVAVDSLSSIYPGRVRGSNPNVTKRFHATSITSTTALGFVTESIVVGTTDDSVYDRGGMKYLALLFVAFSIDILFTI